MPITTLFVEGTLDTEVLSPVLLGSPVIRPVGPKNFLRARVRIERTENRLNAGYLRDRDFDFDPPGDVSKPEIDYVDNGVSIGWRWCRHEIENYLIDPAIVSAAMDWAVAEFEEAVCRSAQKTGLTKLRDGRLAQCVVSCRLNTSWKPGPHSQTKWPFRGSLTNET
jgi:hypothetical protein